LFFFITWELRGRFNPKISSPRKHGDKKATNFLPTPQKLLLLDELSANRNDSKSPQPKAVLWIISG